MDEKQNIKDCLKEIYEILDQKPKRKKIIKKAGIFIVLISFLKYCVTKLIMIFS